MLCANSQIVDVNNNLATLLERGVHINLSTLEGGIRQANSINDFGQIVGNSDGSAFMWENGLMIDLNSLVDLSMSGLKVTSTNSITDLGWIVGDMFDLNINSNSGYVLSLANPKYIPVLAASWLFASGSGMFSFAKRRSKTA